MDLLVVFRTPTLNLNTVRSQVMRIEGSEMPDFNRTFMYWNLECWRMLVCLMDIFGLYEHGQYEAVLIR